MTAARAKAASHLIFRVGSCLWCRQGSEPHCSGRLMPSSTVSSPSSWPAPGLRRTESCKWPQQPPFRLLVLSTCCILRQRADPDECVGQTRSPCCASSRLPPHARVAFASSLPAITPTYLPYLHSVTVTAAASCGGQVVSGGGGGWGVRRKRSRVVALRRTKGAAPLNGTDKPGASAVQGRTSDGGAERREG